jgi:hypothetical protein
MIRASCHCGAVVMEADSLPATVTSCNCSICRRIAGLWAYYARSRARLVAGHDAVAAYSPGTTASSSSITAAIAAAARYESVKKTPESRFAINVRCLAPEEIAPLKVRHFDGADTWKYLD